MSKALATKQPQDLASQDSGPQEILKSDIVVPYLLLQQGMSKLVMEEKAALGEMVKSTTGEKLGNPKKPLEIIPLTMSDHWVIGEVIPGKSMPKYVQMNIRDGGRDDSKKEEIDKTGENLHFEFNYLGKSYKRTKLKNVFCVLPSEIKAFEDEIARSKKEGTMPDFTKTVMPIVVGFRNMSFKAGKGVATHFLKAAANAQYGAIAHGYTLRLACRQEKNDKGIFYVYDILPGRNCTHSEFAEADKWFKILNTQKVKLDDRAVGEDGEVI